MRTFHPKSYSQQARRLCDSLYNTIVKGLVAEESAVEFLHESYRHSLVRHRAAKRLGRKLRTTKNINEVNLDEDMGR